MSEQQPTLNMFVKSRETSEHTDVRVVVTCGGQKRRRVQLHDSQGRAILKMSRAKAYELANLLVDAVEVNPPKSGA